MDIIGGNSLFLHDKLGDVGIVYPTIETNLLQLYLSLHYSTLVIVDTPVSMLPILH